MAHTLRINDPNSPPQTLQSQFNVKVTITWDENAPQGGYDLVYTITTPTTDPLQVAFPAAFGTSPVNQLLSVPVELTQAKIQVTLTHSTPALNSPPTVSVCCFDDTKTYTLKPPTGPVAP
jgi:hypothetical protein